MRRRRTPWFTLLLVVSACESTEVWHINPDGSGKAEIRLVVPAEGEDDLEREGVRREFVRGMLDAYEGVEAWTDVSCVERDDGAVEMRGVMWFADVAKVRAKLAADVLLTVSRPGPGRMRVEIAPPYVDDKLWSIAPGVMETLSRMSDEEMEGKFRQFWRMQANLEREKGKMAPGEELTGTISLRLPGRVREMANFTRGEGATTATLNFDAREVYTERAAMMDDAKIFIDHLRAGKKMAVAWLPEYEHQLNERLHGERGPVAVEMEGVAGPLFDYPKEIARARRAWRTVQVEYGIGEAGFLQKERAIRLDGSREKLLARLKLLEDSLPGVFEPQTDAHHARVLKLVDALRVESDDEDEDVRAMQDRLSARCGVLFSDYIEFAEDADDDDPVEAVAPRAGWRAMTPRGREAALLAMEFAPGIVDEFMEPEIAATLEGLSSPDAEARSKLALSLMAGDVIERAILDHCFLDYEGLLTGRIRLHATSCREKEPLRYAWSVDVGEPGAWVKPGSLEPVARVDRTSVPIHIKPPPGEAGDSTSVGAFGYAGSGKRDQPPLLEPYRFFFDGRSAELGGTAAYEPRVTGIVQVGWPFREELFEDNELTEEHGGWSLTTMRPGGGVWAEAVALPAEEAIGAANGGLWMHVEAAARAVDGAPTIVATVLNTGERALRVPDVDRLRGALWGFIIDDDGVVVATFGGNGYWAGDPIEKRVGYFSVHANAPAVVELAAGRSMRTTAVVPAKLDKGAYRVIVGFGPVLWTVDTHPDESCFRGRVIARANFAR